jgi:hypothetical protein
MKVFIMMLFSHPPLPSNPFDTMTASPTKLSEKRSRQHIENKWSAEYAVLKRSRQHAEKKASYQKS